MKKFFFLFFVSILTLVFFMPVDPVDARPGTRLSGKLVRDPIQWPVTSEDGLVQVQVSTWYLIPHSVTVTSWVADGNFYLGCGMCDTKIWRTHIDRNPRIRVKIGENLYSANAHLARNEERIAALSVPLGEEIGGRDEAYRVDLR